MEKRTKLLIASLLLTLQVNIIVGQNQFIVWPQFVATIDLNNESWSTEFYLQSRLILNDTQFQIAMASAFLNYKFKNNGLMPGIGFTSGYLPIEGRKDQIATLYQIRLHHNLHYEKAIWSNRITFDHLRVNEVESQRINESLLLHLNRWRYLTGITIPFSERYNLVLIEEIFLFRNSFPFSENRIQIGASRKINQSLSFGLYYFKRWVKPLENNQPYLLENAVILNCSLRLNIRKTEH